MPDVRSDSKEVWEQKPEVGMSFARVDGEGPTETEVRALMKVLIGVDPHKSSLAVAAVDEATGQLLERAAFPQNHVGLRALERWARRFAERPWAVENAGGLGRYLAGRLAAAGESVVDVPPKLSAKVRVLSTGNARKTGWPVLGLRPAGARRAEWLKRGMGAENPKSECPSRATMVTEVQPKWRCVRS